MIKLKIGSARAEWLLQKATIKRSRRLITDSDMARHKHTGDNCSCGWKKPYNQKSIENICNVILQCGEKQIVDRQKEESELLHDMMVDAGITK